MQRYIGKNKGNFELKLPINLNSQLRITSLASRTNTTMMDALKHVFYNTIVCRFHYPINDQLSLHFPGETEIRRAINILLRIADELGGIIRHGYQLRN